jgi:DNA-binding NtrC family response regulator
MKTILLVEDDAALRHGIDRHLTSAGYAVIAAEDTMAALEQMSSCRIDLLLTDVVMPKGKPHGIALARMARIRFFGLPVVYITGDRDILRDEGELFGKIFEKPVDMDLLLQAIDDAFDASRAGNELAGT